jgi:hypothetical protein
VLTGTVLRHRSLQAVREQGSVKEMMFALRTDLLRNIANIAKRCARACVCNAAST